MPTYIGNGKVCGLDSDSDGFPDEGLDCDETFCAKVWIELSHIIVLMQLHIFYAM